MPSSNSAAESLFSLAFFGRSFCTKSAPPWKLWEHHSTNVASRCKPLYTLKDVRTTKEQIAKLWKETVKYPSKWIQNNGVVATPKNGLFLLRTTKSQKNTLKISYIERIFHHKKKKIIRIYIILSFYITLYYCILKDIIYYYVIT